MGDYGPDEVLRPKRTYQRRVNTARRWLKKAPERITAADMAKGLGWPRNAATKVLVNLVKEGRVVRVDRGVYALPDGSQPPPPPSPPLDPYSVVDLVLDELFPDGIRAIHLQQVIEWRESTKALLELMEGKG